MKIVMLEPLGVKEEVINQLGKKFIDEGHEFVACYSKIEDRQEMVKLAKDADALIIANSPLEEEVIRSAENLKLISVAFTGVDHVPADLCKERGIIVCNAQDYCTDAVAELTFGLILSKLRNVVPCDAAAKEGKTKDGLVGNELLNKTIGIVGTGAIGRRVAEIAKVFNCKLIGYDKYENDAAKELGIEYVSLEELMAESDIVTLHTPLTEETKLMINEEKISLMKPSSILINCARGPVVDSVALANALNEGKISGAAVDVYEMEPPVPSNHPLLNAQNTITTPHIAFATIESIDRRAQITCDNITAWMDGKPQNIKIG